MMLEFSYTVGIKGRFGLFYRKYKVFGHKNETVGDSVRLVMTLADGTTLAVPEIAKRFVRVYSDYHNAVANQRKFKAGEGPRVDPLIASEEATTDGLSEGI